MPEKQAKHIMIFSVAYFPLVGGAEAVIKEITDRIAEDYDFHLITNRFSRHLKKREKIGNVLVYRVGFPYNPNKTISRRFSNFCYIGFAFFKALGLNFRFRYDVIWPIMAAYAGAAGLFFKIIFPGKKLLLTLQEGDAPDYILKRVSKIRYPIWKMLFKKADRIQAISGFLKDFAVLHGADISKINIVPNGADLNKIRNPKEKLNIRPGEKVIITTSRLVKKNAVDIIIDAVKLLITHYSLRITCLILGEGSEKENLKSQIANLKLQNQVSLLGFVPSEEIYDYLALADVFVRPSRSEGLGSAFLEAMAMGVPIIGTAVGGIPDFLIDRKTGLFCKVDDPKDLAEKIKILFEDENLRAELIKNAKQLVAEKYDWNIISQKMKEIFEHL
ncbi:MAG: glycosyltransferase family 4 protein [Patescibacteria group bacterium]